MMTSPRKLIFQSFDGIKLAGTLDRPASKPVGRAVLVHGMTADREEWGFFSQLAVKLCEIGVASLRFDYRCHGAAARIPSSSLSLNGILNDIDAAYAALTDAVPGTACPTFLVGVSFGGGVCAAWAKRHPTKLKALFLCAPVLDYLADFDKTCGDWRKQLSKTESFDYVGLSLTRPIVNEAPYFSGTDSLCKPAIPIVIFHGDSDSDVPISQSRLHAKREKAITLVEVPGADHGFVVPGDTDFENPASQANYDFVFARLLARCEENCDG